LLCPLHLNVLFRWLVSTSKLWLITYGLGPLDESLQYAMLLRRVVLRPSYV
jgi:hypothetical protein